MHDTINNYNCITICYRFRAFKNKQIKNAPFSGRFLLPFSIGETVFLLLGLLYAVFRRFKGVLRRFVVLVVCLYP